MAEQSFNCMRWAAEWHCRCMMHSASETIVYRCRGVGEVCLNAVIGNQDDAGNSVESEYKVNIDIRKRDFIVEASKLILVMDDTGLPSNTRHEPQPGDEIIWTDSFGNQTVWDVANEGNESAWDEFDRYGYCIRIHTELCESNQQED